MTDPTTPAAPTPPDAAPQSTPTAVTSPAAGPAAPKSLNIFGLIALILGVVGFVLAVTPASAISWVFDIPAIVLGIVGLTRKNKGKGTSIAGLSIGAVAWLVSIIVTIVLAASSVVAHDNSTTVTKGSGSTSSHTKSPGNKPGIGDTVTNSDGVAYTVHSVTCGLTSAPSNIYGTVKPSGQFCQVKFTVKNGSNSSIDLGSDSLTGYIGSAEYDSSDDADKFSSSDSILDTLNPGLSVNGTFYVDAPKGKKLTSVKLGTELSLGLGDVTIDVG